MNKTLISSMLALALSAAALGVWAHGDEPHGDEPHPTTATPAAGPRFEAATEAFELVGRLEGGVLTLFVNRFATSEPVLRAKVELEAGERKAVAAYDDAQGSYAVREPAFLKALGQPGSHALVVTVTAGDEADLLETSLHISDEAPPAPAGTRPGWPAMLAGALGVAVLAGGLWAWRQRRASAGVPA